MIKASIGIHASECGGDIAVITQNPPEEAIRQLCKTSHSPITGAWSGLVINPAQAYRGRVELKLQRFSEDDVQVGSLTILTPATIGDRAKGQRKFDMSLFAHYLAGIFDDLADNVYLITPAQLQVFLKHMPEKAGRTKAETCASFGMLKQIGEELEGLYPN